MQSEKVPVKEYEFDQRKLANVQSHLVPLHSISVCCFQLVLYKYSAYLRLILAGEIGSKQLLLEQVS